MKWYAERPGRFGRQVVADLVAVGWTWFWVSLAVGVRDAVLTLRAPGDGLVSAGNSLRDTFSDAAGKARELPLVGGSLADALGHGSDAGGTLVSAGAAQVSAVETTALWLMVAFIAVPVAFLLVTWLPLRVRYARRAGAAARLRAAGRYDLLALYALNNLSLRALGGFSGDPVVGWREGDPVVVKALAGRQLAAVGLRG
ncbi:hypothetical protein [Actinosynnema sp. NPDC020468]|uniref:hypothetical protein n=1 Tax=Actinosynnema sp. NPDC020468 TaxID=3154488 RepID=UPI0033C0D5F2